ncbi:acyloxyacyl hydrolase [Butyricimonas virosa]|uniref:acyloxyacyl hydrolase n=1 Tax=Butyricimonas virosa TaxID=544645 RepID=UPI00241EF605|nr:acyloxyacyl hydrolase [Butyricimonas virosa]MDY5487463.1 acyloxyacyl hydrolase [Butyricimonas virosa]
MGIKRTWKVIVFLGIIFVGGVLRVAGQGNDSLVDVSPRKFVHGLRVEGRPEYIFPTSSFLKGENAEGRIIRGAFSTHVKYLFRYCPGSIDERIYGDVYQGVGLGFYNFGESRQLGNPVAFYLFQGARISSLAPWLSLYYEWNFGLSAGWKPYDSYYNSYNTMIGSKVNAYINANFYLRWRLSPRVSLLSGLTVSHFSNGNTKIPNAGLNTIGGNIGLECNFYRKDDLKSLERKNALLAQPFRRHFTYDFVFFGSWHDRLVKTSDGFSPSPEAYPVFGFNFTPMYNLNYKLRLGVSLDGTFDGGANLYTEGDVYGKVDKSDIVRPPLGDQFALGLSGRAEYVMPFFVVGVGIGANVIGKNDLNMFYQLLTLKIALSRAVFLHVGYRLQNFNEPNFLMLGIGFRFNGKYTAF